MSKLIKGRLELKVVRVPPLLLGGDTPGGGDDGRALVMSRSGVLFLDEHNRLVSWNEEAIRILYYPDKPDKGRRLSGLASSKIPMDLLRAGVPGSRIAEFLSGRRRYMCTVHSLDVAAGNKAVTAVLLERMSSPEETLHRICNKYNLTAREREAMGYLLRGLTTKEIAQAMAISPNTVKAFVRSAMTKMGVSTRAGLVGRTPPQRSAASGTMSDESNYLSHTLEIHCPQHGKFQIFVAFPQTTFPCPECGVVCRAYHVLPSVWRSPPIR